MGGCASTEEPEDDSVSESSEALSATCTPGAIAYTPAGNVGYMCRQCYIGNDPGISIHQYKCYPNRRWYFVKKQCVPC